MNNNYANFDMEGTPITSLMDNNMGGNMGGQEQIGQMGSMMTNNFNQMNQQINNQLNQQFQNKYAQGQNGGIPRLVNNLNEVLKDSPTINTLNTDSGSGISIKKIKNKKNKKSRDARDVTSTESTTELIRTISEYEKNEKKNKKNKRKGSDTELHKYNVNVYINEDIKQVIIIIMLYMILSLGFVKKTVGNYVSYINPDEHGKVGLFGVFIYGLLLAVLFIGLKKAIVI